MLKTNSKRAVENIRKYIVDHCDAEAYGEAQPETFEEAAAFILRTFRAEHWNSENIRRYYHDSEYASFEAWAIGLPSVLDTCYYYNRPAVDDLGAILEESAEKKAKYSEDKAEAMLTWLIYREIVKAAKQ